MEIRRLKNGDTASFAVCTCSCGTTGKVVRAGLLMRGNVRSCGCLAKEIASGLMTTHGMHRSPEFKSWQAMLQRCNNPHNIGYKDYGARGIAVADEFKKFESFYEEIGPRPKGTTLDRIRTDGNYEPGNIRWANKETQNRNKRSNVLLTYGNKTQTLKEWSVEKNMPWSTLWGRLNRNWTIEDALNTPVKARKLANRLCDEDVVAIFRMRNQGHSEYSIASTFNVDQSSVNRILHRKNRSLVSLPDDLRPHVSADETV